MPKGVLITVMDPLHLAEIYHLRGFSAWNVLGINIFMVWNFLAVSPFSCKARFCTMETSKEVWVMCGICWTSVRRKVSIGTEINYSI